MNMQTNMNFDFTQRELTDSSHYGDTFVGIFSIIALIFTVFFILIPEKNVENSGKELDRFYQTLNVNWVDNNELKGIPLDEKVKKAQYLMDKNTVQEKLSFLTTVHSILMEQKTSPNRNKYLEKVMNDRKEILEYLYQEFEYNKKTDFNCSFADCKEKEQKVTREKLQTIKAVNTQIKSYYVDLINLYEVDKKQQIKLKEVRLKVEKALTLDEEKQYTEMK